MSVEEINILWLTRRINVEFRLDTNKQANVPFEFIGYKDNLKRYPMFFIYLFVSALQSHDWV